MDESPPQIVSDIGEKLSRAGRPNKDFLIKSLRQAANALSQIEQPVSPEASKKREAAKKADAATKPLRKSVVKHGLLRHSDKDVKLLVAICVSELFRILAPEPPFDDKYIRDIFRLILSMFAELGDTNSPYFSRRVKILEKVAQCKCCVIMLDIDCNDLVVEMFNIFFSIVREDHQKSLINDILSIMTHILNEEPSQQLLNVILRNLIKERKGAASQLAVSVIQTCAQKIEPLVCGFLTSCSVDRDSVENELKEFYHEILLKIFQCAPQMLIAVIPNLSQELLTDQVDIRIKAVNLVGKLFALPECHVAQKYSNLFIEFKNRFSDKSVEVRLSALKCAKACYMVNPFWKESPEILSAIEGRLLDFDDRVRTQAVVVACDLAMCDLRFFPPELISVATDRLRDKKISVRKKALQKLMDIYRYYCNKCYEGHIIISDHYEQIPCKLLMLCFDKECREFRPQNLEIILAEDLFPASLPVEERTRHWIHMFTLFTPLHLKAMNSVLYQKQRLQTEMQNFLALRKKEKGNSSEDMQERMKNSFVKMSAFFPDPSKAEECFHKLNQIKDNNIFNTLELLLDEWTIMEAQTTRDKFLKMIGDRHPYIEFLQLLSSKCSVNIFSSEHVRCILDHHLGNEFANEHLESFSAKLLLTIVSIFPSFLRGSEGQLRLLLQEKSPITDILIEILAKAGPHISVKFRDFYPFLERLCLEGTRLQSKHAVSAIASLITSSDQSIFSKLCKELVDSLQCGLNIPTVLQSLGCITQHCVSAFETQYEDIILYFHKEILQVIDVEQSDDPTTSNESLECSDSCKLKIYGLKMLVKSFLPHQRSHVNRKIDELLKILSKMLQTGSAFCSIKSCSRDKPHIRLAAAKAVLRLSRRWDLHISPEIFHCTILISKDSSPSVRRSFLSKTHKLLKDHAIPSRYACSFALAACDCCKDLQDAASKYMEDFIKQYNRKSRIRQVADAQGGSRTDHPAYIVVYFVHILAHDTGFPPEDCKDEELYAQFCSPLFWIMHALLNAATVNGDMDIIKDTVLYLLCIFRAIRRAEDAVDAQHTPKLQILAELGISIINALNHDNFSSLRAPGMIFLPSSLYKISLVKQCDEVNLRSLALFPVDQNFIKRVIHILQSQIFVAVSTHTKRGRKCPEGSLQSADFKFNPLYQASREHCDLLNIGATENRNTSLEVNLRSRRKRALSPIASDSLGLRNELSAIEVGENCALEISKPVLKKKQLSSSCDSVSMKPSPNESQVSIQNVEVVIPSSEENVGKNSGISANISEGPKATLKESSITQITSDSGDVELLCLDSESNSMEEKENSLLEESNMLISNQSSLEGTVDTFEDSATIQPPDLAHREIEKLSYRTKSFTAKLKKGRKILSDASASEVINVNKDAVARRTRRQKA